MYFDIITPGNNEFTQSVSRFVGFKSTRLKNVISALETAQKVPNAQSLLAVLNALQVWRNQDPNEFAARGNTNGVAYRLWMEAKQALQNRYHQAFPQPNPARPGGCPGVDLLGVYVPEAEGHVEICHGFAYRWAIAAGKINEAPALPARANIVGFNGPNSTPVLYPGGYAALPAARAGGVINLIPGDIVAMFVVPPAPHPPALGHSLIAETSTTWYSANNAGTFGVGTGRSRIDTTGNFGAFGGNQVGWVDGGNQWMRPDGHAVHVVYRRIP